MKDKHNQEQQIWFFTNKFLELETRQNPSLSIIKLFQMKNVTSDFSFGSVFERKIQVNPNDERAFCANHTPKPS